MAALTPAPPKWVQPLEDVDPHLRGGALGRRLEDFDADREAVADWADGARTALMILMCRICQCVEEADRLWYRLHDIADAYDRGLIEPGGGIHIIHNHGSEAHTMRLVRAEWGRGGHWLGEAWTLGRQLQRLVDTNGSDMFLLTEIPLRGGRVPREYRVAFVVHSPLLPEPQGY